MSTEKFRRQLRKEATKWREEGLIEPALYDRFANRYDFSGIDSASSGQFISILLGLGGILLGLGAITLVAANWQVWLMSQMFHQGGSISGLYLVWGLGVLAMAYGLQLTSLGVLSAILLGMSYWEIFTGYRAWEWVGNTDWISTLQIYLPLLGMPLFLPLSHIQRSRVLYVVSGLGLISLIWSRGALVHWQSGSIALVLVLIPAVLWVYHTQFWRWPNEQIAALSTARSPLQQRLGADGPVALNEEGRDRFQAVGQSLAIWFVTITVYAYSFRGAWRGTAERDGAMARSFSLALVILCAIALYGGWQWWLRSRKRPSILWMKTPIFFGLLALVGILTFSNLQLGNPDWSEPTASRAFIFFLVSSPLVMNLLLFFIGFAMLHDGMQLGIRHRFWGGLGIVVIGLMSRVFEYNTGLTLKALVLAICGILVIVAGLWFERQLPQHQSLATQSTPNNAENNS